MNDINEDLPTDQYAPPPDDLDQLIERCGYYWHKGTNQYAKRNGEDEFQYPIDERNMMRELVDQGRSRKPAPGGFLSPAEHVLKRIRNTKEVDYVGELCGRQAGYHVSNNIKILCPKGFKMIEPCPGDYSLLLSFWEGLFGKGKNPYYEEQSSFMRWWIKAARISLRNFDAEMKSQIVVLAGPIDCGKSFLQSLITMMLGGRVADPSNQFLKKASFNSNLWAGDHLQIGDEELTEAVHDRHPLMPTLKKIVSQPIYPLTKKFGHEVSIPHRWFVTISVNDDPVSARVIPTPERGFEDKIAYLKCYSTGRPFHDGSPTMRISWRKGLEGQVPAFLDAKIDNAEIRELDQASSRFLIKHFHHPEVVELVTSSMPYSAFGEMLMDWVIHFAGVTTYDAVAREGVVPSIVMGTTAELYRRMGDNTELRGICPNVISFGTRLGQLALSPKWSHHVSRDTNEIWRIDALTAFERARHQQKRA